jgi:hypothetical protein
MGSYSIQWHGDEQNASSPEEAARNILEMIRNSRHGGAHVFYVRDDETGRAYRVDLGADDEIRDGEPACRRLTPTEEYRILVGFRP